MKVKRKPKGRSLTTSELILIFLLVVLGGGYLISNYVLLPKWDEFQMAANNLNNAQIRCDTLEKQYKNLDGLKEEEENLKYKLTRLIKQLPPYIPQEYIIITIDKYAKDNNIDIKTIDLEEQISAAAENVISKDFETDLEELFMSEEEWEESESSEGQEDMPKVLVKYVNVSFAGKISSLYNFINQLEENQHKLFVKELSINGSNEGLLMGNLKIQYIGYKDKNSDEEYKLNLPEINGKNNPFEPYKGYEGNLNKYNGKDGIPIDTYDPNFSLQLNHYSEDVPKFIMSEYKKTETEIYSFLNKTINGKFIISQEGDKFNYTYNLGNVSKSEVKSIKFSEGIIRMEVVSHNRISEEDKMKIVLDVENNTDLLFEITLVNDDYDNPLFELGEETGKVHLKQVNR